jgi:formylglycine-generating enzyme required for sulfatase activity
MVDKLVTAYPQNQYVITSRPLAYTGRVVLQRFHQVKIESLDEDAIKVFLKHWTDSLHGAATQQAEKYYNELNEALTAKYEIRRMASNPMMLTALAVVHWNEKRIPEQRAELYESVITWLLRSREQRPGRAPDKICGERLQSLALSMQNHADGRKTQLGRRAAAEFIAHLFAEPAEEKRIAAAERFLAEEEVDSGIIVGRGVNEIAFWHLTFQEYLAAKALGGKLEVDQQRITVKPQILHNPDWREVLTLFGGVLYSNQGRDKVDGFMRAVLALAGKGKPLVDEARCVGLLGAMVRDLTPFQYRIPDKRYGEMLERVMAIFTVAGAEKVQLNDRLEAAEALGQAGDPRINDFRKKEYWVDIPACTFYMGAQKVDKKGKNYDPDADDDESPVHEVHLSAYRIGKYPVTVSEYKRFAEEGCYAEKRYWNAGGFGEFNAPGDWDEQQKFPNRPITQVSWFEAMAFATWAGVSLPTEAQWERAARGKGQDYRSYPWGNEKIDVSRANYYETKIGHPSPVGLFPAGVTDEGIHDMAGNVWEWCFDWKNEYFLAAVNDPKGSDVGDARVLRGGSWVSSGGRCRSAVRSRYDPGDGRDYNGFRFSRGQ